MYYEQIDPWGESRADLRIALNTSLLAEINRDRDKRREPFTALDFMPFEIQGKDGNTNDADRKPKRKSMGLADWKRWKSEMGKAV